MPPSVLSMPDVLRLGPLVRSTGLYGLSWNCEPVTDSSAGEFATRLISPRIVLSASVGSLRYVVTSPALSTDSSVRDGVSKKPWIVDDGLWARIEPLLPAWPNLSPGPRPVDNRRCLQGILFVLYTGITWQQLPLELGFGSGQTSWRRLGRWQAAGVFEDLHRTLLAELNTAGLIDWTRCVDASHVRAKRGRGDRPLAG